MPTSSRSRGWIPLAYPRLAVQNDSKQVNPYFPFHENILEAAVRELLVLDGTLDCGLALNTRPIAAIDTHCGHSVSVPRWQVHCDSPRLQLPDEDIKSNSKRKRDNSSQHEPVLIAGTNCKVTPLSPAITAEALTQMIVKRVFHEKRPMYVPASTVSSQTSRPPRKVSDSDSSSAAEPIPTTPALQLVQQAIGPCDLSRFIAISGEIILKQQEIPLLLEASIATEATLRERAVEMTQHLVSSFHHGALRLYLGYKTPYLSHSRLLHLLADFLFDASHAFFAWMQTEREVAVAGASQMENDERIKESLFDTRALKKIGGFEDWSILPHALSIQRCSGKMWEQVASTPDGQRLFRHHASRASLIAAGQERRGRRLRKPSSAAADDELNSQQPISSSTAADEHCLSPVCEAPHASEVRISRTKGTAWGISLAEVGGMCVIGRVADDCSLNLCCGDLILKAEDGDGDSIYSSSFIPTFASKTGQCNQWFQAIVAMFKSSNELDLVVQRVGRPADGRSRFATHN